VFLLHALMHYESMESAKHIFSVTKYEKNVLLCSIFAQRFCFWILMVRKKWYRIIYCKLLSKLQKV